MKQTASLCLLCLGLWLCSAVWAQTQQEQQERRDPRFETPADVDFSILPGSIEGLRELDFRHRGIARKAAQSCFSGGRNVPRTNLFTSPCVVRRVATGLERADSAQLTAFHYALPLRVRYDGLRTEVDWRQRVEQRISAAKAGQ